MLTILPTSERNIISDIININFPFRPAFFPQIYDTKANVEIKSATSRITIFTKTDMHAEAAPIIAETSNRRFDTFIFDSIAAK